MYENMIEQKPTNDALTTSEGRLFKKDPAVNVIKKEDFEDRVEKVFHLLWEVLSRSFGPYGAPTIICNYPYKHVTKDGFTIMKNLSMDASETLTDQSIADLVSDICGRLNYTVGDATTTAIVATNQVYNSYRQMKSELARKYIMPRDVIYFYNILKDQIIKKLSAKVRPIQSSNMKELAENIRDVVFISSNGDTEITDYIADFYEKLGNPAITCAVAADGITKQTIIDGYSYDIILNDKMYINNDDKTMELRETDVIIFSIKVTGEIYSRILRPLEYEAQARGRHLIVAAPSYDEKAMQQVIAMDLAKEKTTTGDIKMVLMTYKSFNAHYRKLLTDFSALVNTTVIDRTRCEQILNLLGTGVTINQLFEIDTREIEGTTCIAVSGDKKDIKTYVYGDESDETSLKEHGFVRLNEVLPTHERAIRLGFVRKCNLGLNKSLFQGFEYSEDMYQACLTDAKIDLEEKENKYKKLGTFNIEVSQAQQRLYALSLKMGLLEVGASSELSQGMIKDAVDDSVRAAKSAFDYGVVLGCNCSLLKSIMEVKEDIIKSDSETSEIELILIDILMNGFMDVYRTVLMNAFDDTMLDERKATMMADDDVTELDAKFGLLFKYTISKEFENVIKFNYDEVFDQKTVDEACKFLLLNGMETSVHNVIVAYSMIVDKVFDVSILNFSDRVINSGQTDQEVLNATIDLMALLITGNQMVVTQKRNFDFEY